MLTNKKLLVGFIENIPNEAICPPTTDSETVHSDENFRVDVQGVNKQDFTAIILNRF